MNNKTMLRLYVFLLFVISIISSSLLLQRDTINWPWLFPIILLIPLSETFKIQMFMYKSKEYVSISWTLVLTIGALLSLGPCEAIIINGLSGLFCSLYPKGLPIIKIIYNISANIVTIIITYTMFNLLNLHVFEGNFIIISVDISLIYIVANYSLTIILMRIVTSKSYLSIILDIVIPHIPHSVMLSLIGAVLGNIYEQYRLTALLFSLLLVSLIVVSLKITIKMANQRIEEVNKTLEELIQSLATTIDARDPYVYGHSLQVANYAVALAKEMNLNDHDIQEIKIAGLLHDIGKISISEAILFKEGRLTDEEYEIIKQHSMIGEKIVSNISNLSNVSKLISMHHERYDGRGYPRGLEGKEIPMGAYILGAADTLDAILSDRSYKNARSIEDALNELNRCRGTQFHPDVIDALLRLHQKLGDAAFKNSALLVKQQIVIGKFIHGHIEKN